MKKAWVLAIIVAIMLSIGGCTSKTTESKSNTDAKQPTVPAAINKPATSAPKSPAGETPKVDVQSLPASNQVQELKSNTDKTKPSPNGQAKTNKTVSTAPAKQQTRTSIAVPTGGKANLWVTQDFGERILLDSTTAVGHGSSVLDIVGKKLDIETAYGGKFINTISGLESGYTGQLFGGKKMDWFYWVNGIMVAEGAGDYMPRSGDCIWWDYHDWGAGSFVTSVVGAYPQPFVNGFDGSNSGTVIAYDTAHQEQATKAVNALKAAGANNVAALPLNQVDLNKRSKITIVVGEWKHLEQNEFLRELNLNNRKTGIYVNFATDGFTALNVERKEMGSYKSAGAIVATGRGLGDKNPLWLITGSDEVGLKAAINTLCERPQTLKRQIGVLIHGQEVVGLPVR